MYFILTPYRLTVRSNLTLDLATSLVISYSGPYREEGEWTPTADGKNAVFEISDTLIDRRGTYKCQLMAIIGGVLKRSSFFRVTFENPL